jgi:hypothetical protein
MSGQLLTLVIVGGIITSLVLIVRTLRGKFARYRKYAVVLAVVDVLLIGSMGVVAALIANILLFLVLDVVVDRVEVGSDNKNSPKEESQSLIDRVT